MSIRLNKKKSSIRNNLGESITVIPSKTSDSVPSRKPKISTRQKEKSLSVANLSPYRISLKEIEKTNEDILIEQYNNMSQGSYEISENISAKTHEGHTNPEHPKPLHNSSEYRTDILEENLG
ncbi:hypothetical protein AYI70_g11788 [Smittium culicis]|uniref:Uncharacterized protein n=1 Tax=Smittium culicis TaxID=133412 RepID=A0A1R1X097_9FUNG|nr:hypothetical protein AYI70_g11788 [Smittium culicis]